MRRLRWRQMRKPVKKIKKRIPIHWSKLSIYGIVYTLSHKKPRQSGDEVYRLHINKHAPNVMCGWDVDRNRFIVGDGTVAKRYHKPLYRGGWRLKAFGGFPYPWYDRIPKHLHWRA